MANGKPARRFGRRERGTDRRATRDPPPVDEAARAQAILGLRDKFRADVDGLIKLGRALHKEFVAAGTKLPLLRRTAATELLRVYKALQDFESGNTPRGPGGILMQRTPFKKEPVPWPGRPKSLAAVEPFSDKNVQAWRVAAGESGPPLPKPVPKPVVTKPPKPVKRAEPNYISASLIKVPGMSWATPAGQTRILTNVLRVFSHQALSDDAARAVAVQMDILKYLVLAFEETLEYKTRVLESFPLGHEYSVRLRKEFLVDAQKLTPVPLDANQRWNVQINDFSSLHRVDNSPEEKLWYAQNKMKATTRDYDTGYMPGQVVSNDGIVFVGGTIYMAPGGELYQVKQASRRDQLLEAFRVGVLNSAGGVILAWGVVAIGAAALAAPAIVGPTAAWVSSMVGGSAATTAAVTKSILTHRFVQWLGLNWPALLAEGSFYVALGGVAINFDVRTFVRLLREDPEAALKMLIQAFAELGHSYMEARTSGPGGGGYRTGTADVDPDPSPAPLPPRALATPDQPVDVVAPTPPVAPADTTLKRMIGDALVKQGKPSNDSRMTNPALDVGDAAEAEVIQAPVVVWKSTGTGDAQAVVEDNTTAVTSASRTKNVGTTATKGSVTSTTAPSRSSRNVQNPATTPVRPVGFLRGMATRLGLTKQQRDFLIDNAQTYQKQMKQRADIQDPREQSSAAHVAAEDEVLARWPGAVKEKGALTGVSGPDDTGPRQADTALRLPNPPSDKPARDIVVDFKKTAFVEKPSRTLYSAGYDKQHNIESGQVQAYEVAARQLGLRVYIVNERGEIFTPDLDRRSGWIKIAGPTD